ncbi:DEAD/DEAH box helicase, partial [Candidatus Micrarchaeota archaeon]|nr:DEAD/DEAH box helicase [Candidatus Micrarchaeota archaeon]
MSVAQLVKERFGELTEIQKLTIPKVLNGENVLILAPTGYGKTESALLPVLEKIKEFQALVGSGTEDEGIYALYITPLRALSRDLKERFDWWCERLSISHDIRTGDSTQHERTKQRTKPPKILLTTVESLQALLLGSIMRKHLTKVKFVIVDEIHDILDNKRGAQLSLGLERLAEIAEFQRIGISATVANEREAAKLLFGERDYVVCESGKNRTMEFSVNSKDMDSDDKKSPEKNVSKLQQLKSLVTDNRSLLFVNTRSTAEELAASLKKLNAPIEVHHGSLAKEMRLYAEDKFKSGEIRSLICTSSLELGIDIGDVSLVIQYHSPHQVFRLIQRVGRSGHSMHKVPKGIIFPHDFDDLLESEVIVTLAKNGWMEDKHVERGALDVIAHQLVGICLDFGRIPLTRAHSILSRSYAYGISFEKLRMIALQLSGEDLLYYDEVTNGETPERDPDVFIKTKPRARIYYADFLSTIPKVKRFLLKDLTSNKILSNLDEEFVINLEPGASFLSRGLPWYVVDITDSEVIVQPSSATEIAVPSWAGEDIPVSFTVAQAVGALRGSQIDKQPGAPLPDDKKIVIEIISDLVVVHCCFGSRVNSCLSRIISKSLSKIFGESVRAVSDPYRILLKLPFALKEDQILNSFLDFRPGDVKKHLEEALLNSSMLKFKFTTVGRMFGLLSEDANVNQRFIEALRYSTVYEETIRSIFFRYFDVETTEEIVRKIRSGTIPVVLDKRVEPSYFAKLGIARASGSDSAGAFEPRERMIAGFKETVLSKTIELVCLNCAATRFVHLAGAPQTIKCHKCSKSSLAFASPQKSKEDRELSA